MGEVAAHAGLFFMRLGRGAIGASILVIEAQASMDIVENGLDPGPTLPIMPEQRPGLLHQDLGIAIAAAEEIAEGILRSNSATLCW